MSIRVRYRATELSSGLVETFDQATDYFIFEDRTLALLDEEGETVGAIHPDRWDSVAVVIEAESDGGTA